MEPTTYNLGGYLLDWIERPIERSDILKNANLRYIGPISGSEWERYEFSSEKALRDEDELTASKPFKYIMACRRSGSRIIMLSYNRDIVEYFIDNELSKVLRPKLKPVPIAVDELVRAMTTHPTKFTLTFVHARVPAFGTSLRSVSYYGEDLADTSFFRDNIHLLNFFTCGLRPIVGKSEIVRISSDGTLSFYVPNNERYKEVEKVFRFLREEGYLSTDIL